VPVSALSWAHLNAKPAPHVTITRFIVGLVSSDILPHYALKLLLGNLVQVRKGILRAFCPRIGLIAMRTVYPPNIRILLAANCHALPRVASVSKADNK